VREKLSTPLGGASRECRVTGVRGVIKEIVLWRETDGAQKHSHRIEVAGYLRKPTAPNSTPVEISANLRYVFFCLGNPAPTAEPERPAAQRRPVSSGTLGQRRGPRARGATSGLAIDSYSFRRYAKDAANPRTRETANAVVIQSTSCLCGSCGFDNQSMRLKPRHANAEAVMNHPEAVFARYQICGEDKVLGVLKP
jgi:hypothetical protein